MNDVLELYAAPASLTPQASISGNFDRSTHRINSTSFFLRFFSNNAITTSGWTVTLTKIINGEWTEWFGPSLCSGTCFPFSNGTLTRTRSCSNPAPQNGGLYCSGPDTVNDTCSPVCNTLDVGISPKEIAFDSRQNYTPGLNMQWRVNASRPEIAGFVFSIISGSYLVNNSISSNIYSVVWRGYT